MASFIEVPGGRLCVVEEGAGPPIVLVHAGIACLESWDALAPLLAAAGYRVVRYDARGWGRSTTDDVAFAEPDDLVAVLDAMGSAGRRWSATRAAGPTPSTPRSRTRTGSWRSSGSRPA